jgi:hypothetical protein
MQDWFWGVVSAVALMGGAFLFLNQGQLDTFNIFGQALR